MNYRFADKEDFDLLAKWNHQLIRDEGHRNPMTVAELRDRIERWLAGEYLAVIYEIDAQPVAYALFTENDERVYLRQLFVDRDYRGQGIGSHAVRILREKIWPQDKRLIVGALTANTAAVNFWRNVGFQDYCLTLEIMPEKKGDLNAEI